MLPYVVPSSLHDLLSKRQDVFSIWGEHRRIDKQKISMDEFFSDTELTMIGMN